MNPESPSTVSPNLLPAEETLRVLILYEDVVMGHEAKRVVDLLDQSTGAGCRLCPVLWKMDVLNDSVIRHQAAQDAAQADILFFACHRDHEIPEPVKWWFDAWIGLQAERTALVVIFDGPETYSAASRLNGAFLAAVARRGNMDLFISPSEDVAASDLSAERLRHGAEAAFLIPASVLEAAGSQLHWGIND